MDDFLLSRYGAASVTPSPVNRMMSTVAADLREGVDVNLGVGYVNENTIPRAAFVEAVQAVLADPVKYRFALNYGGSLGSPNLIDSLRRFHIENCIGGLTADLLDRQAIIIGPNGASSLLEGMAHVLAPGIIVTTDPIYYIYSSLLERLGFDIVAVPEDDEGIRIDRLEARLHDLGDAVHGVRCLYVVTVSNPTCTILSNARRRELVRVAGELSQNLGRRVPLVLDKAYENLIHDPSVEPPESALLHDERGLAYEIGTLSKILAPALRIGYLMGPPGPLVDALVQKTSDSGFSAPLITQEAASWLLDHHVADQLARVNAGYRGKATRMRQWIDDYLGDAIEECRGGQAGFYFYLTFRDVETREGSPFFRYCTRTTGTPAIDGPPDARHPLVLYVPGEFCVHSRGDMVDAGRRQMRLSYGFEEPPRIEQALRIMREAVEFARKH
ncbi:MAG: PLP-dependent aminotransferase family protein [Candidatus Brocadiae bacterium]|nr:PLP-dependent aminotransferase family protein [Candidatus Brocadiia bacterium]